jgi:hypothetical protein
MNRTERQELAHAMRIGGECLVISNSSYVLDGVGEETDDLEALLDLLRLLRVMMRYQRFDLEVTRRERDDLLRAIEGGGDE